uniref:Secreted protein n=1 Tax=Meloidogyne hapla TaxID=6305 RepID=A0A1I8B4Q7_MELHA
MEQKVFFSLVVVILEHTQENTPESLRPYQPHYGRQSVVVVDDDDAHQDPKDSEELVVAPNCQSSRGNCAEVAPLPAVPAPKAPPAETTELSPPPSYLDS